MHVRGRGKGGGWREVGRGSWAGVGWAGGKVGHSRVMRVSSSNKDSALSSGHTTAYGNALVPSCWVNRTCTGGGGACKHGKRPYTGWWPGMRHLTGLVSVWQQPLFIVRLERSLHRDITAPRPWVEGALSRVFMDRPSTPQNTRASHTFYKTC